METKMYIIYALILLLMSGCSMYNYNAEPIDSDYTLYKLDNSISVSSIDIVNNDLSVIKDGEYYSKKDSKTASFPFFVFKSKNDPSNAIYQSLQTCVKNANNGKSDQQVNVKLNLNSLEMMGATDRRGEQRNEIKTKLYYDLEILTGDNKTILSEKNTNVYGIVSGGLFNGSNPTESFVLTESILCNEIIKSINRSATGNKLSNAKQLENIVINVPIMPEQRQYDPKNAEKEIYIMMQGRETNCFGNVLQIIDNRDNKYIDIQKIGLKTAIDGTLKSLINTNKMSNTIRQSSNDAIWEIEPTLNKFEVSNDFEKVRIEININMKDKKDNRSSKVFKKIYEESESIYDLNNQNKKRSNNDNINIIMGKILNKMRTDFGNYCR